jgi:membrane dipeptidase
MRRFPEPLSELMDRREFMRTAARASALAMAAPGALTAAAEQGDAMALDGVSGSRLQRAPYPWVDGLSFMPVDKPKIAESGLSAFICDVSDGENVTGPDGKPRYVRSYTACTKSITAMRRALRAGEYPGAFHATKGSEIAEAHRNRRTAVFFQFQGCEPLEEDLRRLDVFHELGLRVLQITHHYDNPSGGGALETTPKGLTPFGRRVVERMNELGIVPDVSHASDLTALDTAKSSRAPVILSHGAARAIVPNARCAPDAVIKAVADTGGVVGIFMMTFWLTNDATPTVDHVIAQLRHVIKVGGIDAVGIANDYPLTGESSLVAAGNDNAKGIRGYLQWWNAMRDRGVMGFDRTPTHVVVPELNNIRRMYTLHEALEKDRFTAAEMEKIMGGNWIRVLRATLG